MDPTLSGVHHITAIASDPQRNLDFYAGFAGLRLVKRTVNFDDPGTYHFYFGDERGRPGTILTFFPWPGARRGRQGAGQVTTVSFGVAPGAIAEWEARAQSERLLTDIVTERFGERVLRLYDPDGLPVEFIETPGASGTSLFFHGPELTVAGAGATADLLAAMGATETAREGARRRFSLGGSLVDLVEDAGAPGALGGAGTVHHIAWRTPDTTHQQGWRSKLALLGQETTPILDRKYFQSIYFREPGGVLFEIATDPPGFTVDEPAEGLGSNLQLPPWLEAERTRIEQALPVIELPVIRA